MKRWAWGASDDAYIIKQYILDTRAPFLDKTIRVFKVIEDHFLWPVNWFVLDFGGDSAAVTKRNFQPDGDRKTLPQVSFGYFDPVFGQSFRDDLCRLAIQTKGGRGCRCGGEFLSL